MATRELLWQANLTNHHRRSRREMIWFADTSALVKRYLSENGSAWLRGELVHHEVLISQLTPIELAAAFSKRLREGSISRFVFYQARRRMLLHLAGGRYSVLELNQRIVDEAIRLTFSQPLR